MSAVRIAQEHQVQVMLDPAPARALPDSLLGRVAVGKPNTSEARTLTGIDVRDRCPSLPYRPAVQRLFQASAAQPTASTLIGGR
jgi:sugar/nucleoside kinase (ribokinase family)